MPGSSYLILFALYIFMARESRGGGGILLASPQPAGLNFGGMFGGRYYTQPVPTLVQYFFFFLVSPFFLPDSARDRDPGLAPSRLATRGRKSEVAVTDDGQFVSPDLRFGRPPGPAPPFPGCPPPDRLPRGGATGESRIKEQQRSNSVFSRRNQIPPSARPPIS